MGCSPTRLGWAFTPWSVFGALRIFVGGMRSAASGSSRQFKHIVDIAWRRKWWFVVSVVLSVAVSLLLVSLTPKVYRAATTILVSRQGISESIMRSTATMRTEEWMRSLELQIFSHSYLERVARKLAMIPADASEAEIEETCRQLRARVFPELDKLDFSWFRISVEDVDPKRAAGIANELAALLIGHNSSMRVSQAAGTLEATETWEARYRLELTNRDRKISEFKRQNIYDLPDQQPANLQLLNLAESRATQLESEIWSRNDRLVTLRAEQQARRASDIASALPDAAPGDADPRHATLQRELQALLARYTEDHPLVRRQRAQIAELVLATPPVAAGAAPAIAARPDPIAVEIATVESELSAFRGDRARELAAIENYRARIGSAPRLQPQLFELTRGYEELKHQFDTALAQSEQAQHSQDVAESKQSDQFQIQDPAYPPVVPYNPNFLRYVMAGIGLGLAIGVGTVAARELVDQTVRGEEEFAAWFPDLPVYGVVPNLNVDLKSRRRPA